MGDGSNIEWTDATWNPLVGCSRTSPGCDHCYAIPTVARGEAMGTRQHVGLTVRPEGGELDWTGEVRLVDHLLDQPIRWRRPRRVFVNSLSDVFHESLPMDTIAQIFAAMALAPQHQFQVLTKRSRVLRRILNDPAFPIMVDDHRARLRPGCGDFAWPLPNVWLGVSIESDRYTFRADHLRDTPAAVRWISAEPLLGRLETLDLEAIDWIVAGGESAMRREIIPRPCHPSWLRDLRDRCAMAGVPFLLKQWGNWAPIPESEWPRFGRWVDPRDGLTYGARCEPDGACPGRALMSQVGKRAAGRELDGRTHDGYPRPLEAATT